MSWINHDANLHISDAPPGLLLAACKLVKRCHQQPPILLSCSHLHTTTPCCWPTRPGIDSTQHSDVARGRAEMWWKHATEVDIHNSNFCLGCSPTQMILLHCCVWCRCESSQNDMASRPMPTFESCHDLLGLLVCVSLAKGDSKHGSLSALLLTLACVCRPGTYIAAQ